MKIANGIAILAAFGFIANAQPTPAPDAHQPVDDAVARQRQAILDMKQSLAMQRATVQQQTAQHQTGTFFLLPPPAPFGAGTGEPPSAACSILSAAQVDALIADAAKREELDPDLLRSVMKQESGFNPCAVSPKGAMGLMQLMPATVEQFGVEDPFSPAENVGAGAKLLKDLLKRYNSDRGLALGAYNAGPAEVDAAGGIPQFRETLDYINRILRPGRH